ncbi:MAG TPA: STAS/SEC14 domain-containing protein [Lacipirellulaceae bacterium]|nr:STAS/SEC14 domain-containing protein [Lacipirellulaceae bacterium]
MPVEIHEAANDSYVEVSLSGKLTKDDYEHFVPVVEAAIEKHGKIRLVVALRDFHGWTAGALWEDMKFDWKHFSDIDRLALVGDKKWEAGMAVFCRPFTRAKIRYFDLADIADARQWMTTDSSSSVGS